MDDRGKMTRRIPPLDGLRGVAAFAVLISHALLAITHGGSAGKFTSPTRR
jgi:peptidoglycan/LPS O-acetylase OafA/YrhL